MSAKNNQIGGNHYSKLAIQPMEYALKNNLNYAQSNAIKYITRYKDKGGIHDLHKAIHCIELLIQHESEAQSIAAGWTPGAIEAAAFRKSCGSAEVEWPEESRIDVIGQNGNDGAVYSE